MLGSSAVSPGGGSAAALTAALGAALVEMVARLNANRELKKQGRQNKARAGSAQKRILAIKKIRGRLTRLMALDARAFIKLSKFFKEKKESLRFQKALHEGAKIPFEICELSLEALKLGALEKERTGQWLASDLAEAGILLESAFHAGRLNVEINLRSMRERKTQKKFKSCLDALEKKAAALRKDLEEVFRR